MTDEPANYDRRSVLKMTGAGLVAATGIAGSASAQSSLPKPENLEVSDRGDTTVYLDWDEPSSADPDHYEIDVYDWDCGYKGCYSTDYLKTVVVQYGTSERVTDLRPSSTRAFRVYSVDANGNRGNYTYTVASTEARWQPVHTRNNWDQSTNELGGSWDDNHFSNGGQVTSDGLYLEYDGSDGIFETYFADPDGSGAWTISDNSGKSIKLLVYGDDGSEEEDAKLTWDSGQESDSLEYYAYGTPVETSQTVIEIPLVLATRWGTVWDVETPEEFKLEFGQLNDRASGLLIDSIWVSDS